MRTRDEVLKMFKNYLISRGIKESSTAVYVNVMKYLIDRYMKEKKVQALDDEGIAEMIVEIQSNIEKYKNKKLKSYSRTLPKAIEYFGDFSVFLNQLNLKTGGKAGRYEVVSNLLGTFEADEVDYQEGLFRVKTTAGEKLLLPSHVITYVRERD